ncbi:MAG: leucine-rich repeat domain-containing protein, partial [Clostridia bacterium]|nr:leucine-rich repeat domain-containing protein [Clostridia bacterium]
MKKLLAILAALILLFAAYALAEETLTSGDYQYRLLDDGTAEITEYDGSDKTLEIPSDLDGHAVTSIGDHAFFFCDSLTSITIPDSVTSIDINPFMNCEKLIYISASSEHEYFEVINGVLFSKPDGRLVCYPGAFTDKEYSIPDGIQAIGKGAFSNCNSLISVTIPESVT